VRKLGLDRLGLEESHERKRREILARLEIARAALAQLDAAAAKEHLQADVVQTWRARQQQRIARLDGATDLSDTGLGEAASEHRVELALIRAERARLNALLRADEINDEIRRRVERDLDLDEERLRRNVRGIATDEGPDAGPTRI
jgi:CPA1 family monovalent cation:H+ antiporter